MARFKLLRKIRRHKVIQYLIQTFITLITTETITRNQSIWYYQHVLCLLIHLHVRLKTMIRNVLIFWLIHHRINRRRRIHRLMKLTLEPVAHYHLQQLQNGDLKKKRQRKSNKFILLMRLMIILIILIWILKKKNYSSNKNF